MTPASSDQYGRMPSIPKDETDTHGSKTPATTIDFSLARWVANEEAPGWPLNGFVARMRRDKREVDSTKSQDEAGVHAEDCLHASVPKAAAVQVEMERVDSDRMEAGMRQLPSQEEEGVFVTWEDVWVTAWNGKAGCKAILQGITGYAQPGEVLAIMGPSGSGKSTFLDALAGRLSYNTRQSGEILINGRKQALAFGTSAYSTQDDALMTTLTVREAMYYSAQLQLPESMGKSEKKERAEMTIKEMGLYDAMDTRIGGSRSEGLSWGEKRRVSICMEILTRPQLLFLDEPTSGLDSAASYHVMKRIVALAKQGRRTIITSIHQPSSDVFEFFDNLGLLSAGRTIYFGPAASANEFFTANGFPCPPLRNPSEHFLRTINKDFDQDIDQHSVTSSTAEIIEILVKSFNSITCKQVKTQIGHICRMELRALEKKGSQASFLTQCAVLTKRSFLNKNRDLGYYWLRLVVYAVMCLCIGNIYYGIGNSFRSIQARGLMLMFVSSIMTFMTIGGFPSFVEEMKVFNRERLNGHYGVGAFVISNTISSIPYLVIVSVAPCAIAYFLVELHRGISHFLYFVLVLFVCMMLVEGLMMIVASFVPDFFMGIMTGAGIQGLMILNNGFFRPARYLPRPFWKYPMYYIAFHNYATQGLYKNEFLGLNFPTGQAVGSPTISGKEVLESIWEVENEHSKWVDLVILFGMVFVYRFLFLAILKVIEKIKPLMRAIFVVCPKKLMKVTEQPSIPPH